MQGQLHATFTERVNLGLTLALLTLTKSNSNSTLMQPLDFSRAQFSEESAISFHVTCFLGKASHS